MCLCKNISNLVALIILNTYRIFLVEECSGHYGIETQMADIDEMRKSLPIRHYCPHNAECHHTNNVCLKQKKSFRKNTKSLQKEIN